MLTDVCIRVPVPTALITQEVSSAKHRQYQGEAGAKEEGTAAGNGVWIVAPQEPQTQFTQVVE